MVSPPSGFIARPKVRSVGEATSLDSHDRIVSVAKNALQSYIASFLDTTGFNRQFTAALSPQALQFVTDKSLQSLTDDANRKPVQLARMFNDIRMNLPAIMIIDAGLEWEESGLGGGLERTSNINGKWQGWYRVLANINVVVAAVAKDVETASQIQNLLSIFCKQLRNEAGGSRMTSGRPGDYWEVRLPMNFSSTINQPTNVSDDPKDQIYASTIEMELQAEDLFVIEKPIARFVLDDAVIGDPDLARTLAPTIDAPSTVKLGDGPFMIFLSRMDDNHRVILSDGRIASIDPDALMITPHRTGSFDISIIDERQTTQALPAPGSIRVVAQKTITVTF